MEEVKITTEAATGFVGALTQLLTSVGFYHTLVIILIIGAIVSFIFIIKSGQLKTLLLFFKKRREDKRKKKEEKKEIPTLGGEACPHFAEMSMLVEKREERTHDFIMRIDEGIKNSVADLRSSVADLKTFVKSEITVATNPIISKLNETEERLLKIESQAIDSDKKDDLLLSHVKTIRGTIEQQEAVNLNKKHLVKDTVEKVSELNKKLEGFLDKNKIHGIDLFLFKNGNHSLDGSIQFSTFHLKHSVFDENSTVKNLASGLDCSLISSFLKKLNEHIIIDFVNIKNNGFDSFDKGQRRTLRYWLDSTDNQSFTFITLKNKCNDFYGFACFYNDFAWYEEMYDVDRIYELEKKKDLVNQINELLF